MIDFFICLIISVFTSCGAAIILVEKGKDYPIRKPRLILKRFIHRHISRKISKVLDCSTCISFWINGFIDCILCIFMFLIFGQFYFFWPLSGFITAGTVWFIIEFLNALDKEQNINIFIDKEDLK